MYSKICKVRLTSFIEPAAPLRIAIFPMQVLLSRLPTARGQHPSSLAVGRVGPLSPVHLFRSRSGRGGGRGRDEPSGGGLGSREDRASGCVPPGLSHFSPYSRDPQRPLLLSVNLPCMSASLTAPFMVVDRMVSRSLKTIIQKCFPLTWRPPTSLRPRLTMNRWIASTITLERQYHVGCASFSRTTRLWSRICL